MSLGTSHLNAIIQVADKGGFTRAAEALHITQPALSHRISEAERLLKVQIFDRSRRSIVLTPTGEGVVKASRRAIAAFDLGIDKVFEAAGHARTALHIAALPSLAAVVLPPAIRRVELNTPGFRVEITSNHSKSVVEMVEGGTCDFGVSTLEAGGLDIWSSPILKDTFVALVPSDWDVALRQNISWKELTQETFILPPWSSSLHSVVLQAIGDTGYAPSETIVGGEIALTAGLVAAGLGVAIVPKLTLPLIQFADLSVLDISGPEIFRTIHCIARSEVSLDAAPLDLIEAIKAVALI